MTDLLQSEPENPATSAEQLQSRNAELARELERLKRALSAAEQSRKDAEGYRRLFETAKDGIVVIDVHNRTVQEVNAHFLEMTGYAREDFVGRPFSEGGKKLGLANLESTLDAVQDSELVRFAEVELRRRDQSNVTVDVIGNPYKVGDCTIIQFNIRDVSARKRAAKALRESEQRFRLFVESVRDYALFQMDSQGVIVAWNTGAERLVGWTEREAIGKNAKILFTPEDVAAGEADWEIQTAWARGRAEDERWHLKKDGTRFFASGVLTRVSDDDNRVIGFAKVMRDVTEWKRTDEQLRRSLTEKDTLVREIHHRVKNNLQVVISLLSLQSRQTTDPHVLAALENVESRLRAIARIHEGLYASRDLTHVDVAAYITGLAQELAQLHAGRPDVSLELQVPTVALHIDQTIPLGLIANELILNALKHGLRGRDGRLTVNLACGQGNGSAGLAELCVTDTGPGFPHGFDLANTETLGLRLVVLLARQLGGHLKVQNTPGAQVCLSFPLESRDPSHIEG